MNTLKERIEVLEKLVKELPEKIMNAEYPITEAFCRAYQQKRNEIISAELASCDTSEA